MRLVTLVFLIAYLALWIGILLRRFTSAGAWAAIMVAVGLLVTLPSGAMLGVQAYRDQQLHEAVVTGTVVPVREGPSPSSKVLFEVHEGTSVRITDHDQSFAKIRLRNNLEGWADATGVHRDLIHFELPHSPMARSTLLSPTSCESLTAIRNTSMLRLGDGGEGSGLLPLGGQEDLDALVEETHQSDRRAGGERVADERGPGAPAEHQLLECHALAAVQGCRRR